jgi:type IV pilus assembly protein PilF
MNRLIGIVLLAFLAGCAAPQPELTVDTGTTGGETGDARSRARVHTELAALYYSRRNMAVALEELRVAQTADPTYPPTYGMFGLVYMELKENQLAERSFQDGLRIAPQDPDLNHNYGWFLCQSGRAVESIKFFRSALRNPLYATPWRSNAAAGVCALRIGQAQEAEAFFEQALRDDPSELNALLQLGQMRYDQNRLEEARRLVGRYNKLIEPTAESLWLAVRVERKLGERNAEQSYANQLRRRHPTSAEYQKLQRGEYD